MFNLKKSLLTLAAASLLSVSAMADTGNVLQDDSLDLNPVYNGWNFGNGSYSWNNTLSSDPTDYYVLLRASGGRDSYMTQTFNTVAGTTYTLSFDYLRSAKGAVQFGVQDGATDAGDWLIYQALPKQRSDGGAWTTGTYTFTALSNQATLGFVTASAGAKVYLDNISVVAAVPEPASMALFLAGLGALGVVSRRRRVK